MLYLLYVILEQSILVKNTSKTIDNLVTVVNESFMKLTSTCLRTMFLTAFKKKWMSEYSINISTKSCSLY